LKNLQAAGQLAARHGERGHVLRFIKPFGQVDLQHFFSNRNGYDPTIGSVFA
jgi:hypothetical protein